MHQSVCDMRCVPEITSTDLSHEMTPNGHAVCSKCIPAISSDYKHLKLTCHVHTYMHTCNNDEFAMLTGGKLLIAILCNAIEYNISFLQTTGDNSELTEHEILKLPAESWDEKALLYIHIFRPVQYISSKYNSICIHTINSWIIHM